MLKISPIHGHLSTPYNGHISDHESIHTNTKLELSRAHTLHTCISAYLSFSISDTFSPFQILSLSLSFPSLPSPNKQFTLTFIHTPLMQVFQLVSQRCSSLCSNEQRIKVEGDDRYQRGGEGERDEDGVQALALEGNGK